MVIYGAILGPVLPNALANILIAAIISTPAAIAIAALMVPFEPSDDEAHLVQEHAPVSWVDAIIKGTADGVPVVVGIITVLLVAITMVTLVNMALGLLPFPVTLQGLLAWPFQPLMWLLGIPWAETQAAATLMATKTVLNEFVAYLNLAALPEGTLSGRSRIIMTYALCGFANFGSLGILVGGMGAMVPERRVEIVGLGFRSLVSGTLATCMSGAIAGMLWTG
jgi:CNT family concentrative nucleoside transporter